MSSPLQNNITNLQSILDTINNLLNASSGGNIPQLANYECIDGNRSVAMDTMVNNGEISLDMDGLEVKN